MFILVNGIQLFYEKAGEGPPILLLHGNGEDHTIFDALAEDLARTHTVYAPDSRCHGKSADAPELSYDAMAADIICFIEALSLEKPILYGFSDGGIVGLLISIKRPDMLSRLIISGANTDPRGIKARYTLPMKIAHFFTRDEKLRLMLKEPNISQSDLHSISIPTLVLAGERDMIITKHTQAIAKNIPGSELCIVPGEGHASYVIHSQKLYPLIRAFLRAGV